MKKILMCLLAVIMLSALVACAGDKPENPTDDPSSSKITTESGDPSDPVGTDPGVMDPADTDPANTDPVDSDPAETDSPDTDPGETQAPKTDPVDSGKASGEDEYVFDIREDDHTIIMSVEKMIQVFHHDGVKVTGYECYCECNSVEEAKMAVENNQGLAAQNPTIQSVTRKGKYMVLTYNESGFPYPDYETLKIVSDAFKAIG